MFSNFITVSPLDRAVWRPRHTVTINEGHIRVCLSTQLLWKHAQEIGKIYYVRGELVARRPWDKAVFSFFPPIPLFLWPPNPWSKDPLETSGYTWNHTQLVLVPFSKLKKKSHEIYSKNENKEYYFFITFNSEFLEITFNYIMVHVHDCG